MGVVHKLKNEVIEFVITQKKQNPTLSCRKLVEIIDSQFQIKLSKSSINSILKTANLSSPVGRRISPGIIRSKFQIPDDKKKQLFGSEHHVFENETESIPKKSSLLKSPSVTKDKSILEAKTDTVLNKALHKTSASPIRPYTNSPEVRNKQDENKQPPVFYNRGPLYDAMGCIFLKAAEWEMADSSILGSILRENILGAGLTDLDTAGEILTFLEVFGIKQFEDLPKYSGDGLWALHSLKTKVNSETILNLIDSIQDFNGLKTGFLVRIPQIVTEINYMRIVLEDGAEIWVDPQMTTFWSQNSHIPIYAPVNKVLSVISKQWLYSSSPLIFCSASCENAFTKETFSMISAFDNTIGKKIVKIAIYNERHSEIAVFTTIPQIKRKFIAGLWPWQKEFQQFLDLEGKATFKIIKWDKHKILNFVGSSNSLPEQEVIYSELVTSFVHSGDSKLRVLLLRQATQGSSNPKERLIPPFIGLITNLMPDEVSADDIIISYLSKWPNLHQGYNVLVLKNSLPFMSSGPSLQEKIDGYLRDLTISGQGSFGNSFSKLPSFDKNLNNTEATSYNILLLCRCMVFILNIYAQKYYFPALFEKVDMSSMISNIYSIKGHLTKSAEAMCVTLSVSSANSLYRKDLEFATKRINESKIVDFNGRNIFVKLI